MANICFNRLRLIGTHHELVDVMALIAQGAEFSITGGDGAPTRANFLNYDERSPESGRHAPLSRVDTISSILWVKSPLRYRGYGDTGWRAPKMVERQGFDASIRDVELPEELLDGETDRYAQPVQLLINFDTKNSPMLGMLRILSERFPAMVVEVAYSEPGNGVFGARSWLGGELIASCDYDPLESDEATQRDDEDEDDFLQRADEERANRFENAVRESVTLVSYDSALTKARRAEPWCALTRAAHEGGVLGIAAARAWPPGASSGSIEQHLRDSLRTSRSRGRAAWLDLCFYENAELDELIGVALGSPGVESDGESCIHPIGLSLRRTQELLEQCADTSTALSGALVNLLSDPQVRLASGGHPIGLMVESMKAGGSAQAESGLNRVVDALIPRLPPLPEAALVGSEFLLHEDPTTGNDGLRNLIAGLIVDHALPSQLSGPLAELARSVSTSERGVTLNPGYRFDPSEDDLMRSLLFAGLQGTPQGLRLALAAGFDEAFLFRSVAYECPQDALDGLRALKPRLKEWPPEYREEIVRACAQLKNSQVVARFDALMAEALMADVIGAQVNTSPAASQPRRRKVF